MGGGRASRRLLVLFALVACSSSTVNCGPCGPTVQVLVTGLLTNAPVRACLPDVGAGTSCVTVVVRQAANGVRRCQVAAADGRLLPTISCDATSSAGTASLIDRRLQRPSAYRGTSVTVGQATGRFAVTAGHGPCGCDRAVASVDING